MVARSFRQTIAYAVGFFGDRGYTSAEDLNYWLSEIRKEASSSFAPEAAVQDFVKRNLTAAFVRFTNKGGYAKFNSGVSNFAVQQLSPLLQDELNRRVVAATHLIHENREKALINTSSRLSGWATSIGPYGTTSENKIDMKRKLGKPIQFAIKQERNLIRDQTNKMISSLNNIIASNRQAIAGEWHSRWQEPGYNYREDHKERDKGFYTIRGNWAEVEGLMKRSDYGYTDQITQPCEEPNCKCSYTYVYKLNDLPEYMLTEKGKKSLQLRTVNA